MSYGKFDDQLYKDPGLLRVTPAARWLHMAAVSFSLECGSLGHLDAGQVRFLVGAEGCRMAHVTELVTAEEWSRDGDRYAIRDFEQRYCVTPGAARQRRWRDAHRDADGDGSVTPTVTPTRHSVSPPSPTPPTPIPDSSTQSPVTPPKVPPSGGRHGRSGKSQAVPSEYQEFVAELSRATGRRFTGDEESRRKYAQVRHGGRSADDLLAAARGVVLSPFHTGQNDAGIPYNAPLNVLRSKQLDQLIALGRGEITPRPANGRAEDAGNAAITGWLRQQSAKEGAGGIG